MNHNTANKTSKAIVALLASGAVLACTSKESSAADAKKPELGSTVPSQPRQGEHGKSDPRPSPDALEASFTYYDGSDKRTVWLSRDLVAEFAPTNESRDALLQSDPAATEVAQPQKSMRLWRVRAPQGLDPLTRNLSATSMRFSPVFHDGPLPTLPMRALPGGVIVTFQQNWDRAKIDAWLAARSLAIASEVIEGANVFEIASAPGLPSLELANQLYETGELAGSTPNFWTQMSAR